MTPRRILAIVAFAFLIASTVDLPEARIAFNDRAAQARAFEPTRGWPGYGEFLDGIRAHTPPRARIAIAIQAMHWQNRYDYAYYRASYALAGREVLPLIDSYDRPQRQNLRDAEYVAVFNGKLRAGQVIWRSAHGELARMKP